MTDWPEEGRVEMKNYSTRYRPGLSLVLRGVNVAIEPMEKVGQSDPTIYLLFI
jgi:ATP-binding cassette subfamily C (CFTR/MRP) protein 1